MRQQSREKRVSPRKKGHYLKLKKGYKELKALFFDYYALNPLGVWSGSSYSILKLLLWLMIHTRSKNSYTKLNPNPTSSNLLKSERYRER